MKLLALVLSVCLCAAAVQAGNIDYLTNRSAGYIRNFARNAATEGADLATYNPAGLVLLDEGLHISFGNEFFLKKYTIEAVPFWDSTAVETYESTEPTLIYPDVHVVYRRSDWAVFGAFTVPAGGGTLDYTEGIYSMPLLETAYQQDVGDSPYYFALMNDGRIKASAEYLAGTLGASWAASDVFSVSLAGRYIRAKRSYDGQGEFTVFFPDSAGVPSPVGTSSRVLDVEKTADGFGGVVSLNMAPSENLNVALRFETRTALDFRTAVTQNDWEPAALPDSSFTDGHMQRRDLPAILAGGVSYRLSPAATIAATFNYYLVEEADQGPDDGLDDGYVNGLDIGVGLDYRITPRLLGSVAYLRSDLGGGERTFTDLEYSLNTHCAGGGFRYGLTDDFAVTVAAGRNIYDEGRGEGPYESCTFRKKVWYFGLGAEVSFR